MTTIPSLTDIKDTLINTITRNKEIITGVVTGASETTKLVVSATNNEQWGPTGPQMRQIADLTFNYGDCTQVMEAIWERLETDINFGANWRIMYKALLLLDYIIRNGSERIVNDARQNIYQIKGLSMVHFQDSEGIDRGISIRERSKQVVELLGDTVRLREERKKCKQNRDKYSTAYGNESMDYRFSGRVNPNFDEDDFPNRRIQRTAFSITEADFKDEDFKDDTPHKPTPTRPNTRPVQPQPEDDFEPFVEPTVTPNVVTPAIPKPNPNSNPNTGNQGTWDPFTLSPAPANPDNWDNFNPRGTAPGISAWPSQPSLISPPINANPVIPSNPIGPSISSPNIKGSNTPSTAIPANLFVNNTNPNPPSNPALPSNNTIPPNLFVNNTNPNPPSIPGLSANAPKNTVPPLKSNDPWAAQHLFNFPSPRSNTSGVVVAGSTNAKPLGATVGPGWGIPNSTPTVPPGAYTYPNTINMNYPVTYATYPVTTTSNMFSTQNYSNTSQWGI